MKIYTKIILDKDNNYILKDYYEYKGKIVSAMGIHWDYKSTRSAKLMEKQAKREKKLLERKLKREAKSGPKKEEKSKPLDESVPISLESLTSPEKE
tara:strand:- start:53 stop:340 length:288 start_codon:yes stop_codon:yes gene_type:complete